jgi:hypothetical protein
MKTVTIKLSKELFLNFFLRKILFISFLFFSFISFSQNKIQYVFSETTESAIGELRILLNNDEVKISNVIEKIKQLESQGKIILSTSEYAPIKSRIDAVKEYPIDETEIELKAYAVSAKKRYIVITDLLK